LNMLYVLSVQKIYSKILRQNSQSPSRDLNKWLPEHEAEALPSWL